MFCRLSHWLIVYRVLYEVSPYYRVLEEKHGPEARTRSLQGGFDVDIYGVNTKMNWHSRGLIVITCWAAPGYGKSRRGLGSHERFLRPRGNSVLFEILR